MASGVGLGDRCGDSASTTSASASRQLGQLDRVTGDDLVGGDLLEGDGERLAGHGGDLRRHVGAEALAELVEVGVDLPGPLAASVTRLNLESTLRSRSSSIRGFIIVSWICATDIFAVEGRRTRRTSRAAGPSRVRSRPAPGLGDEALDLGHGASRSSLTMEMLPRRGPGRSRPAATRACAPRPARAGRRGPEPLAWTSGDGGSSRMNSRALRARAR